MGRGNPNPVQNESLKSKQFKPIGDRALARKAIGAKFPQEIAAILDGMPSRERSQFLRDAVSEKLARDSIAIHPASQ